MSRMAHFPTLSRLQCSEQFVATFGMRRMASPSTSKRTSKEEAIRRIPKVRGVAQERLRKQILFCPVSMSRKCAILLAKKAGWLPSEKYRYWFCSESGKKIFFFENDIFLRSKGQIYFKGSHPAFLTHIYEKFYFSKNTRDLHDDRVCVVDGVVSSTGLRPRCGAGV